MLSTSFPNPLGEDRFNEVDALRRQWASISGALYDTEAMRSYREDFLVRMAYNSNAIEGSTLTLAETEIIYEGEFVPGKPGREQVAARGIFEAADFLEACRSQRKNADKELILDTHERCALDLQPRARGIFRSAPAIIRASRTAPTPPLRIREEIDDLLFHYERLLNEAHPLIAIAWFHAAFEAIHPFADGNGRTGRLLMNAQLEEKGYVPVCIKAAHALEYKQALEVWQADGEDQPFIDLLIDRETDELNSLLAFAEQFPAMSSENARKPVDRLLVLIKENPSITAAQAGLALDVSQRHAQRLFGQLQDEGLIRREGPNKGGTWAVLK